MSDSYRVQSRRAKETAKSWTLQTGMCVGAEGRGPSETEETTYSLFFLSPFMYATPLDKILRGLGLWTEQG